MRRLRVTRPFSGVVTIPPGEYDSNDDNLYALAGYLLRNGYAELIADEPPTEPTADVPGGDLPPATEPPKKRGRSK
jgi:hypothetical protein